MTGGLQGRGTRRLEVGNSQICVGEGNLESVMKGSEGYGKDERISGAQQKKGGAVLTVLSTQGGKDLVKNATSQ